ncbi:MAG: YabP/YqfC family sporulation protein [Eubacteriales bacterium]|nr:YabP/YqfC family sporulation protein [Eubacteriales bacterium]MDD4421577.1 YabP/YqfC family sporulation protein [Eubacteriales bacterium]
MQSNSSKHTINLIERKTLCVTAVDEVVSFDDTTVTLSVSDRFLNISGSELSVTKLSLQEGEIVITGDIDAVVYFEQAKRKSVLGRLKK